MRGIYLLPNLFTAANLACGFCAILKVSSGNPQEFKQAAWLILLANVFDTLDGRVARWTKATSKFGVEFDSLADLVAFGVAPAVLLYHHVLKAEAFWGPVIAFIFVLCGAARLARFNVGAALDTESPSYFFNGCPIPAASSLMAASVLVDMRMSSSAGPTAFLALTLCGALMMISSFPYPSMKKPRKPDSKRRAIPLGVVFFLIFLFALITYRERVIFLLVFTYFISGPMWKLGRFLKRLAGGNLAPLEEEQSEVELEEKGP